MRPRDRSSVARGIALIAVVLVGIAVGAVLVGRLAPSTSIPRALADLRQVRATVGGRPVLLVVAADPARGLMDVTGLGDLDGMLFAYDPPADPERHRFWMQGVRIPLDVAFFATDGRLIAQVSMPLCPPIDQASRTCPLYTSPAPFAWALETPAGSLPVAAGARLELPAA